MLLSVSCGCVYTDATKWEEVTMHKLTRWMLLALTFASASLAQAQGCNNRFVAFGDSLTIQATPTPR